MLIGAFAKSAQFPFHFWLPNAMAAPTPVSAYLHSATMVKAGVFLLVRFWPVLGGTDAWFWIVTSAGMTTFLLGAFFALFQHDLKGLLAYSTISHLGLITTLAGLGTPLAIVAAIFHIMNHAVFKASLFMAAGIIDHETGTRDMRRLSGLRRPMPYTATLAIVASGAMAGVPLLNGFLRRRCSSRRPSRRARARSSTRRRPGWRCSPAPSASPTRCASSTRSSSARRRPTCRGAARAAALDALSGRGPGRDLPGGRLRAGVTVGPYLHMAAVSVLGPATPATASALARDERAAPHEHGGAGRRRHALCAAGAGCARARGAAGAPAPEGPAHLRAQPRHALVALAARALPPRWAPSGCRPSSASWCWSPSRRRPGGSGRRPPRRPRATVDPVFALVWLVGAACAVAAAWQAKYHRFAALALLGGAGIVTCVTFVWFSAPDLAVTQLLVEIVTTVLLLLGLRWLPKRLRRSPATWSCPRACAGRRPRDRARLRRRDRRDRACGDDPAASSETAAYFLEHAYSEGGGTNVVNVILVDFRAFDTFGEISVLGIVGLTVFALLRRFRPARESVEPPEQQRLQVDADAGPDASAAPAARLPARALGDHAVDVPGNHHAVGLLFLRGHDLPGGGFAAGVALAIGFLLQYLAANVRWVEDRLRILPLRWMGLGLLTAAATGIGVVLFGYPFLTAHRALHRPSRWSAGCRRPPRCCSTSASSRWSSGPSWWCSSRSPTSRCGRCGRGRPGRPAEAPAGGCRKPAEAQG